MPWKQLVLDHTHAKDNILNWGAAHPTSYIRYNLDVKQYKNTSIFLLYQPPGAPYVIKKLFGKTDSAFYWKNLQGLLL